MGKVSTRKEMLACMRKHIAEGKALLFSASGSGLNAKLTELAGADAILVLHTGRMRQRGLPSIAHPGQPTNDIVRDMIQELFPVTKEIPLIAGVDVGEFPADGNLDELIDSFMGLGFSGIVNFQSAGSAESDQFLTFARLDRAEDSFGDIRRSGEETVFREGVEKKARGVGFAREVELIHRCNERDIFTAAYVYSPEQAAQMARAGVDCIIPHCGGTAGGLVGHIVGLDFISGAKRMQEMFDAARSENPEVILLGHGGPFGTPEATVEMYKHCSAQGFVAGSGMDRIPIEEAIMETGRRFINAKKQATEKLNDERKECNENQKNS